MREAWAHHGQVAQVLTDLTPPLRGLQLQPLPRLFLPVGRGTAALVAAVAGGGMEAGLEQLPPLPQLRVPVQTHEAQDAEWLGRGTSGPSFPTWGLRTKLKGQTTPKGSRMAGPCLR